MNKYTIKDIERLIDLTLTGTAIEHEWLENRMISNSQHSNGSFHLYYRLFYRIAQLLHPNFTVELGGWRGLASGCFAGGYELGTVVSIDHHGDPGDDAHQLEMLKVEHQFPRMHYLQGWTWDKVDDVKKFGKPIEILFIDGWHMYDKAIRDWEDYSPLLADGALVICDDLLKSETGAAIAGMWRFWEDVSRGFESTVTDSKIHDGYPMGFFKYEY